MAEMATALRGSIVCPLLALLTLADPPCQHWGLWELCVCKFELIRRPDPDHHPAQACLSVNFHSVCIKQCH